MQLKLRNSAAALAAVIALTAALLGATPPTIAGASVAQQAHSASTTAATKKRGTVKLGSLVVIRTEDVSGSFGNGDELYIRSGGRIIWRAHGSVEEGAGEIAVNRKVKVGATVALYDADGGPDSDDLLGAQIVEGARGNLRFTNDDAAYLLSYG